jgi:hypothetical protein
MLPPGLARFTAPTNAGSNHESRLVKRFDGRSSLREPRSHSLIACCPIGDDLLKDVAKQTVADLVLLANSATLPPFRPIRPCSKMQEIEVSLLGSSTTSTAHRCHSDKAESQLSQHLACKEEGWHCVRGLVSRTLQGRTNSLTTTSLSSSSGAAQRAVTSLKS